MYGPPLVALRYTLYPDTVEELAAQVMATVCCTVPPVPDRATDTGVLEAVLVTCTLPVTAPLFCGANVTVIAALLPEASVKGAVRPEAVNPVPAAATLLMVTLTVDGLLTVTV